MNRLAGLLALLGAGFCGTALAATDCATQALTDDEELSAYLFDFATDCAEGDLAEKLRKYELPPLTRGDETVVPTADDLVRMGRAWRDIALSFRELKAGIPDESQMDTVFADLDERATKTLTQLQSLIDGNPAPDISLLGAVAWSLQSGLELPEVPGAISSPLLDVGQALNADCADHTDDLCAAALAEGRELMYQWNLARHLALSYSNTTLVALRTQIVRKDEKWNRYLYDSKPMLPLDFAATDFLTRAWRVRREYPNGFREPAPTQWFFLHPAAAVEYVSDVADGEQLKPTLYVEVIGANRWDPEKRWSHVRGLRAFSGVSLVASYADRAGVKDTGYGVLLTFNNVYSIGLVEYDDDSGVFITLDLANLLREKYKPKYEKFKERLEAFQNEPPP